MARGVEKHFGPEALKALFYLVVEEFNRNREWHSKPTITVAQIGTRFKELFDQFTSELEE